MIQTRDIENQMRGLWLTKNRETAEGFAVYDWATGNTKPKLGVVHEGQITGKIATPAEYAEIVENVKKTSRQKDDREAIKQAVLDAGFDGVMVSDDPKHGEIIIFNSSAVKFSKKHTPKRP